MKNVSIIILIVLLCIVFSGCNGSRDITDLAFIIAIGIDKGENGMYNFTFQSIKPSTFTTDNFEQNPLVTSTISAPTIYSAMDIINTNISEKCDYSHIKLVVFSKQIFEAGAENPITAMLKSNDFHPNTRVVMAESSAKNYLISVRPTLDTNPAEYYENIFKKDYSTFSVDTQLKDFETSNFNVVPIVNQFEPKENSLISNDVEGMAILNNCKLVATAVNYEAYIYKFLNDNNFSGNCYVMLDDNKTVVKITKSNCCFNSDLFVNPPITKINIIAYGEVVWSEFENIYIANNKKLKQRIDEKLETDAENFLYKCSKVYKTDILNICEKSKYKYLTNKAWKNEKIQNLFENMKYEVNVNTNIEREGINTE